MDYLENLLANLTGLMSPGDKYGELQLQRVPLSLEEYDLFNVYILSVRFTSTHSIVSLYDSLF